MRWILVESNKLQESTCLVSNLGSQDKQEMEKDRVSAYFSIAGSNKRRPWPQLWKERTAQNQHTS